MMTVAEASRVDQLLQEAMSAYGEGRFNQAEVHCREILKQQPDHIPGMQVLAAVAGQFGVPRSGIEVVEKIIALHPRHSNAYIQLAKLLRQDGKDEEAIAALKTAIELEPESAAAYNDLGLIHLDAGDAREAAKCFDRAIALNPEMAIAHFNKGLALERQGLQDEACAAFRNVIAVDANFAEAYAKVGNLLLMNNERSEAFEMFRRAAEAKPDSSVAWMSRAKIRLEEGKAHEAEETVRHAIERDPRNSDAQALLGSILMELGQFDDASAAADLAIALNRRQLSAYHELTNARKLTERDRPLVAQMEWMLQENDLTEQGRIDVSFALGKAYDDYGEYEKAIQHFDEGNRLKHRRTSCDHRRHAASVDRQIATFNADFFSRNAALGSKWDVPVLVLGMPRSGTTLVEQILSSHPDVAAGGELAFWCDQISVFRMDRNHRVNSTWLKETAVDYEALLTGLGPKARRVTDKMPHNFNVIALIHTAFPRARIIHCMRNPVDTCLSIYFQNFNRRADYAFDRADLVSFYRQYERLMAHWRSVLPTESLLEVQYEKLVANPEPLTRKMLEFCGLEWDDACLHHERNVRPVRTASLWQARQPLYQTSVARWHNYRPWLGELAELLTESERSASAMQRHDMGGETSTGAGAAA
jgi:tetratricopeptide (TPR) repeat protein